MKILIVGPNEIFSIENFYVKYLREEGHEVFHYPAQTIFNQYYGASTYHKLLFRSKLSGIYFRINQQLKKLVSQHHPDVVWVFKGMEIFSSTLEWVKEQGCYMVNYNPDNPFLFSGKGSGNANLRQSIRLYDLYMTYDNDILQVLTEKTNCKTALLPFGFTVSEDILNSCEGVAEVNKVCFVGNPDTYRATFIENLANEFPVDVYGVNWATFISHPNVNIFPVVLGDKFWRTLRIYRVQLNLMRPHNPHSHNMRSFEVPGIGGILLAPDTPDHRTYFTSGEEIFLFSDVASCKKQVEHLLSITKEEADKIRLNARQRSIDSGYTYKDRTKQVIRFITQARAEKKAAAGA